jgi:hypothetical protein
MLSDAGVQGADSKDGVVLVTVLQPLRPEAGNQRPAHFQPPVVVRLSTPSLRPATAGGPHHYNAARRTTGGDQQTR